VLAELQATDLERGAAAAASAGLSASLVPGSVDVEGSDASVEAADCARKQGYALELNPEALGNLPEAVVAGLQAVIGSMNESGLLWGWTTFPITLPKSSIAESGSKVKLEDAFGVQKQSHGTSAMQKLTKAQLTQVRRTGMFENDSGVEGLPDVWQLPRFLACGAETLALKRRHILAFAFEVQRYLWIQHIREPDFLSCRNGLVFMFRGMRILVDIFFGWRWMQREHSDFDIEQVLHDKLLQSILANVGADGDFPQVMAATEIPPNFKFTDKAGVVRTLDLSYVSPSTCPADLSMQLMELDKAVQRRRRSEGPRGLPRLAMQQEELHKAMGETFPVFGPLLDVVSTLKVAEWEVAKQRNNVRTAAEVAIDTNHPIRKLVGKWRDQEVAACVEKWRRSFCRQCVPFEHMAELIALEKLREHPRGEQALFWWIHILERKLDSYASPEPAQVRAEMERVIKPAMSMTFRFVIWRPKNWIIDKHISTSDQQISFSVTKFRSYDLSSRVPGWRLAAMGVLVLEAGNNGLYWLFVSLIYGPLGICALCSPNAYYPQMEVNPRTGELEKNTNLKMESMCSRLSALWTGIMQSRRNFEEMGDRGILGKSTSRPFNLVWNYLFRGFLGTLLLIIGQPLLTLLHIPICLVMILTPVLWAPVSAVLGYLACILVYDWVNPRSPHYCLPLAFGLLLAVFGLVTFLFSVVLVVLMPVLNVVVMLLRLLLNFLWAFYDAFIFCFVIRSRARVPVSDSFTGRRIAGPGLSANYYFQISPAIALVILQETLEVNELQVHQDHLTDLAKQPLKDLREALRLYIQAPFGLDKVTLAKEFNIGEREQILEQAENSHVSEVRRIFGDRRRIMSECCGIGYHQRRLVRQSQADFLRTQEAGSKLIQEFAEKRWLPLLSEQQAQELWDSKDLSPGDWVGLTRNFLESSFSHEFVNSSFETMDANGFRLEVTHQGLEVLVDSLVTADASVKDPLSRVSPVCPREEGKAESGPSVLLQYLLDNEPRVCASDLLKVYQRKKGWGNNPAPAPEEIVDRPACYVFPQPVRVRQAPREEDWKARSGPWIDALAPVQVQEIKNDDGLVCGRLGPPHSGWVSLAKPGDRLRFGWPYPLHPAPSAQKE